MKPADKEMKRFSGLNIMVATTVIEVGGDVPSVRND
jgi:RecG-like helicase